MNVINSSLIKNIGSGFSQIGKTEKTNEIEEPKKNFIDFMKDSISEANNLKKQSDVVTADFLAGKTDNLHEVMIAAQKAEVSISFVTEVRNRVLEGYQEFTRMQL